jgi:hypothetical protein
MPADPHLRDDTALPQAPGPQPALDPARQPPDDRTPE